MTYEEYKKEWKKLSQQRDELRDKVIEEYNEKYKDFLNKKVEIFYGGRNAGIAYYCGFKTRFYDSYGIDVKFNKVKKDGKMSLSSAGIFIFDIDKMELKLMEE